MSPPHIYMYHDGDIPEGMALREWCVSRCVPRVPWWQRLLRTVTAKVAR